jgi:hypothetical protein
MKSLSLFLVAALPLSALATEPAVTIRLGPRHGHVTPERAGYTHTAAGNIAVAQPAPDIVIITMTGVAVAAGHPFNDSRAAMTFDLNQEFKIVCNDPKVKKARLEVEARVTGMLRADGAGRGQTGTLCGCSHSGTAEHAPACVSITSGPTALASLCVGPHAVACGEFLSLNCQEGPCTVPVAEGCYTLHQTFGVLTTHPHSLLPCNPASAEFAPDPALDPTWISYWEPFRNAAKKDFGFQVIVRVSPE